MSQYELTDFEWSVIQPLLLNKPRGVPRVDDRRVLNGIFWVLRTGAPWRALPGAYGPYTTCCRGGLSPITGRPLRGTQRRVTLGTYPALSLAQARVLAGEIADAVARGEDPVEDRKKERAAQEEQERRDLETLTVVVRRFLEVDAKRKVASLQKTKRTLELHALPELGDRLVRDIRPEHVHVLLDEMVERDLFGAAREVRKHLSRVFNWACHRRIVESSPMHGMIRPELRLKDDVGRELNDDELRAIWAATDRFG